MGHLVRLGVLNLGLHRYSIHVCVRVGGVGHLEWLGVLTLSLHGYSICAYVQLGVLTLGLQVCVCVRVGEVSGVAGADPQFVWMFRRCLGASWRGGALGVAGGLEVDSGYP